MENLEGKSTRTSARGGHEAGGHPPLGRAPYPHGPPVRQLTLFSCRKKANFREKNHGEGFRPIGVTDLHIYMKRWNRARTERRNRERQRDRSNLGGAIAPPTPWRPWTRGETLLPSREKVKEEEEGGVLSPPSLPVAPERHRGPSSSPRSTPTRPPSSPTSP